MGPFGFFKSLHGKQIGLDAAGNLLVEGAELILNWNGVARRAFSASPYVAAGSTLALTVETHDGKIIKLDTLTGSVVTLPAATGSGAKFRFHISVLATSNSHKIQVANATDVFVGIIAGVRVDSGNAVLAFAAASTSDTITLDRSNGSVSLGEWIEVEDVASGKFAVRGFLSATGAAFATPFSAAVS